MLMSDWDEISYFKHEEFKRPDRIEFELVYALDRLREFIGQPIIIHDSFAIRPNNPSSQHCFGRAVDCHAENISLMDFYLSAERFMEFRGIGIYLNWIEPGLHLDNRIVLGQYGSRWGCETDHQYTKLDAGFFKRNAKKLYRQH